MKKRRLNGLITAFVCILIILGGIAGMSRLASSRKMPPKQEASRTTAVVETIPAEKQDIAVSVTGYGEAAPVRLTAISAQVSGRVTGIHPSLDQGGRVREGDILFTMDTADFKIEEEKALIQVELQKNQMEQLNISLEKDRDRLKTVRLNTCLAKTEYLRLKQLYDENRVGTLSGVEAAEQAWNTLMDTEKNLEKAIALYPLQIQEAQSSLADAQSDLKAHRLNLSRCVVTAPFTGRIRSCDIETGTFVSLGTTVLTLADDNVLEIRVPLSDQDAFEKLRLGNLRNNSSGTWDLDRIDCRVETVTGNLSASLAASVHRVVRYDSASHTVYLAVRVSRDAQDAVGGDIPLMDGMFCRAVLKGKAVSGVVKVPASVVSTDRTLYLARKQHLKTLPVTPVMETGDTLYVTGEFLPGDQIIVTPLAHPVENMPLALSVSPVPPGTLAARQ